MNIPIPPQGIRDKFSTVIAREVGLSIVLGKRSGAASYYDSFSEFVEDSIIEVKSSGCSRRSSEVPLLAWSINCRIRILF